MDAKEIRVLPSGDPRWKHLYYISERLSEGLSRGRAGNAEQTLKELKLALGSIHEAFPREIDPVLDPEGFAMRRLAAVLLNALRRVEEQIHE